MTLPDDAVARLRLIRTDSIGPITYRQLLARFGSAAAALAALPDLARRGGRALAITPPAEAEAELAALDQIGATMIFIGTPAYPALLAALDTAPPVLAARGLLLVGLDIIGDCLTEINVTSPTCFREITDQTGFDVPAMFMTALERRLATAP